MTNETDDLAVRKYDHIAHLLTKYVGVLLYLICLFATTMNILTFMQQTYQKRACSLYLLAASVCDFVHLNVGPLPNVLQYGFHYDWAISSDLFCRLKSYVTFVFTVLSATFTMLASIDRFLLSSRRTCCWKLSTRSVALRSILFTTTFWFIFTTPIAFCSSRLLHSSHNEQIICSSFVKQSPCPTIQILYNCLINGLLPPVVMIIFGILTCTNARSLRRRSLNDSARIRLINYQLTIMLVLQILKSGFTSLPFSIFNCYRLLTAEVAKSPLRQTKENLVNQAVYLLFWSNYTSFFAYMQSSDIFRYQCRKAVKRLACCFCSKKQRQTDRRGELKYLATNSNVLEKRYKPVQIL